MAQQLRTPAAEEALLRGHAAGDKDDAVAGESKDAKRARAGLCGVLRERKVVELARAKRRLVEVPTRRRSRTRRTRSSPPASPLSQSPRRRGTGSAPAGP